MKNNKKITVGILFGGQSAEHEISLLSAKNVAAALDSKKFTLVLIKIDKSGKWLLDKNRTLLSADNCCCEERSQEEVVLIPGGRGKIINLKKPKSNLQIDVIFPVLHGPFGEDGIIQGVLKAANVPFVGSDVLGSAIGMDKDIAKKLLSHAGIPVGKFLAIRNSESISYKNVVKQLGLPLFVKPANLGSSVGISKVTNEAEFKKALKSAFKYDTKVILEEYINGRELECAVLGNDNPVASIVGEIIVNNKEHDFYSYDAKYLDEEGAALGVPATLPNKLAEKIRALAIETFKVLEASGLARVDFFLKDNREIFVNEINTLPGFTAISMYPRLWAACNVNHKQLVAKLIKLAFDKYRKTK